MHGDSATLERGVEDKEDAKRDEKKEQGDGDTNNIEDGDGGVECVIRNTVLVVSPREVCLGMGPPSAVIMTLLHCKLGLCIKQWVLSDIALFKHHQELCLQPVIIAI